MQQTLKDELQGIVALLAAIWGVFLVECLVPYDFLSLGVTPRTLTGLVGIPLMPFLHADWRHITSNTLPLLVLLVLLAGSQARSWQVVLGVVFLGGGLLWLVGRPATHVGASGLIFGLMVFLIVSGLLERRLVPLCIALVVGFLYGGSLLSGVIPHLGSNISWDGHLCGAAAGGAVAFLLTRLNQPAKPTSDAERVAN